MFSKGKTKDGGKKRSAPPTIISADLRVDGDITSEGEIQIDGVVDGDVRGARLSIGQGGTIKGSVTADRVLVRGRVTGQIKARMVTCWPRFLSRLRNYASRQRAVRRSEIFPRLLIYLKSRPNN